MFKAIAFMSVLTCGAALRRCTNASSTLLDPPMLSTAGEVDFDPLAEWVTKVCNWVNATSQNKEVPALGTTLKRMYKAAGVYLWKPLIDIKWKNFNGTRNLEALLGEVVKSAQDVTRQLKNTKELLKNFLKDKKKTQQEIQFARKLLDEQAKLFPKVDQWLTWHYGTIAGYKYIDYYTKQHVEKIMPFLQATKSLSGFFDSYALNSTRDGKTMLALALWIEILQAQSKGPKLEKKAPELLEVFAQGDALLNQFQFMDGHGSEEQVEAWEALAGTKTQQSPYVTADSYKVAALLQQITVDLKKYGLDETCLKTLLDLQQVEQQGNDLTLPTI